MRSELPIDHVDDYLICGFEKSVGFRVATTRINQLDAEAFTPVPQFLADELWAIVSLDFLWYAEATDYVLLEKTDNFTIRDLRLRFSFFPFCEVVSWGDNILSLRYSPW